VPEIGTGHSLKDVEEVTRMSGANAGRSYQRLQIPDIASLIRAMLAQREDESMKPGDRVKLPKTVAKLYEAVEELKAAYPGRHFTLDGHLVGSIGEVVAREIFGFELLPASAPGHDAMCSTRGRVQIKITAGKSIALRAECDHLIVLRIVSPQEAEIVYDGKGDLAWRCAGPMQKNGQRTVRLSKLETSKQQVLRKSTK
jgi:hypothetical protein